MSARRAQRLVSLVATCLITLCLWIGAPASASAIVGTSCSRLDASCLTQGVGDDVGEITRTGGDAVKDIGRRVDDTVEGTIDAVERVVGTVGSQVPLRWARRRRRSGAEITEATRAQQAMSASPAHGSIAPPWSSANASRRCADPFAEPALRLHRD